jgi:hypothetical protein
MADKWDPIENSAIYRLHDRIMKRMAREIEAFPPERKKAVNEHIIASIAGEPTDDSVLASPTQYGDFASESARFSALSLN